MLFGANASDFRWAVAFVGLVIYEHSFGSSNLLTDGRGCGEHVSYLGFSGQKAATAGKLFCRDDRLGPSTETSAARHMFPDRFSWELLARWLSRKEFRSIKQINSGSN